MADTPARKPMEGKMIEIARPTFNTCAQETRGVTEQGGASAAGGHTPAGASPTVSKRTEEYEDGQ